MAESNILAHLYNRDKEPPSEPHDTKSFGARCHCSRIQFTVTLPTASLPLRAVICHCSICRYTHGAFASMSVKLPPGIEPQWTNGSAVDKLTSYTKPGGGCGRLFCPSCGTHVGHIDPSCGQWGVAIGIFDEKFWQVRFHTFPKSALDGGLAEWLPNVGGQEVVHLNPEKNNLPVESKAEFGLDGSERLRAECYCGGVSFTIPRPSQEVRDDEYLKMYVSPTDPTKWKAFMDFCRDCTRLSGPSVMPWLMVPRILLEPEVPQDLRFGTVKTYKSSEPNTRGFCGVCGATVLLATTRRLPSDRQAVVNVALGILRAPEGVKAENWATWRTGNPAWANDARSFDADFVDALTEAHKKWGIDKYGQALDYPVI